MRKQNEVIHFGSCSMGRGHDGLTYVLLLKDALSGYLWLLPYGNADNRSTTDGQTRWCSTVGVVKKWVLDQGSHFKNLVIRELVNSLKASNNFTLTSTSWSSGPVEVVCSELL